MFDIGGWEFMLVVVLGIIIIGPKELPATIRTVRAWVRKARDLAREFQGGLDDMVREAELDDVRQEIESGLDADDLTGSIGDFKEIVDPDGEIRGAFDDEDTDWYSDPAEDDGDDADGAEETPMIAESGTDEDDSGTAEAPDDREPRADAGTDT